MVQRLLFGSVLKLAHYRYLLQSRILQVIYACGEMKLAAGDFFRFPFVFLCG